MACPFEDNPVDVEQIIRIIYKYIYLFFYVLMQLYTLTTFIGHFNGYLLGDRGYPTHFN